MLRVYGELKARLMAGDFLAGERLDPGRLAGGLSASRTPVRDALLQLSGEGLVDSWEQEGFRAPHITEPAIRDIYEWTNEVLHVVIRATSRRPGTDRPARADADTDYPSEVAACFHEIAICSANREHHRVIDGLNDRSAVIRVAEAAVLDGADEDIAAIRQAITANDWTEIGRVVDHFHRRRMRVVTEIAAVLRPREPQRT